MYYKSVHVTMNNYKSVFKDFSVDIQDEVRSALLDKVDISRYIDICASDSYKLGQFRMAIRECIPNVYLTSNMTGKAVNNLRWCFSHNISILQLLPYLNKKACVDSELLESLCEGMRLGADISEVNFFNINKNIVNIVISGLVQKYPMWLCEGVDWLDEKYVHTLIRGMAMGIDVAPFVQCEWRTDVMILLFYYSGKVNINNFLSYITNKFSSDLVESLLRVYMRNIPIDILASKTEDGEPIYNAYQVDVLQKAVERGYTTSNEVFNPALSDMEMERILEKNR